MADNTLYYGDNLDILWRYIGGASVDLIYLDPPFGKAGQSPICCLPFGGQHQLR